jgi:hypothetical protein
MEANMRRPLLVTTVLATLALAAQANEGMDLRSKSLVLAASTASANAEAPFRGTRDPLPELMLREEQERRVNGLRATCDTTTTALCYDTADRRVVYKGARSYMPQFEGLRAESVSLRHDRITLKYSFK